MSARTAATFSSSQTSTLYCKTTTARGDIYDARIGGGLPETGRRGALCEGDTCQGQLTNPRRCWCRQARCSPARVISPPLLRATVPGEIGRGRRGLSGEGCARLSGAVLGGEDQGAAWSAGSPWVGAAWGQERAGAWGSVWDWCWVGCLRRVAFGRCDSSIRRWWGHLTLGPSWCERRWI